MHQTQWSPEKPLPPPVSLASQSHHEKPPEVTCTSRGNPGFPAKEVYIIKQHTMLASYLLIQFSEWQADRFLLIGKRVKETHQMHDILAFISLLEYHN